MHKHYLVTLKCIPHFPPLVRSFHRTQSGRKLSGHLEVYTALSALSAVISPHFPHSERQKIIWSPWSVYHHYDLRGLEEQKVVPGIEDYHKMPVLCILTCDLFYCFMIAMWCHYTAFTHIANENQSFRYLSRYIAESKMHSKVKSHSCSPKLKSFLQSKVIFQSNVRVMRNEVNWPALVTAI